MKVRRKQKNSRMCLICGLDNPYGLRASFYVMEDFRVVSPFSFAPEHQSYPGRVHGGMITAMLDELGYRAYWVEGEDGLGVTMTLETKYRKPVPYGVTLLGVGRIETETPRFLQSAAEIRDLQGNVLASAKIRYIKMEAEKITDASLHEEFCYHIPDDIVEIDC